MEETEGGYIIYQSFRRSFTYTIPVIVPLLTPTLKYLEQRVAATIAAAPLRPLKLEGRTNYGYHVGLEASSHGSPGRSAGKFTLPQRVSFSHSAINHLGPDQAKLDQADVAGCGCRAALDSHLPTKGFGILCIGYETMC